jgi:aminopeptidase
MNNELLKRYAYLIVRQGMNVQPGQVVNVSGELVHVPLMRMIVDAAYDAGALYVGSDIIDPYMRRSHLRHASHEGLDFVPKHFGARLNELAHLKGCQVRIVGMEDPAMYADIPPARSNRVAQREREARSDFYELGINGSHVQWCVVAGATQPWAAMVFPDLPPQDALEALWNTLFSLCRVDCEEYLEVWKVHSETLHRRCALLDQLAIKDLYFTGGGTNLKVSLSPQATFGGGTKPSILGHHFTANLPTEEVFTTPDWRGTEGVVRVTRPVRVNGVSVENLELQFNGGVITDFTATAGADSFAALIGTDEGAKRLGEVALVDIDSPVYKSGKVFHEILLDENATSHIAVGSAYKSRLKGGPNMSTEELKELGWNDSAVHTDFMIGSEEVDVVATSVDGTRTQIISKGKFIL